ncbi:MAG: tetratricopeptide repeat protein [Leptolyngbya sp.]|nr:tetratricopeptide repeat protein [Leptolyngbya sp.]
MQLPPSRSPRSRPFLTIEDETLRIPRPADPAPPATEADRLRLRAEADQALTKGLTQFRQGQYVQAFTQLQQALVGFQQAADAPNAAKVLLTLAHAYYRLADYLWAADYGRQCLNLAQNLQDQPLEQQVLEHLGNCYRHLGDPQTALNYMGQSLQLAKELNDVQSEMRVLNNLAMIYRTKGLNRQAATLYESSWIMAKALGDTKTQLQVLQNLGNTYQTLRHYTQAIECYEQFLRLYDLHPQAVPSNQTTRRVLTQITHASLAIQDYSRAIVYLQRHLDLACALGNSKATTALIDELSQCYVALNEVRSFKTSGPPSGGFQNPAPRYPVSPG